MSLIEIQAAKAVLSRLAPIACALAVAAGGFAAAEVYEHRAPWGLAAQRNGARTAAKAAADSAKAWKAQADGQLEAFHKSEDLRKQERDQGVAALNRAQADADARVAAAKARMSAIQAIVTQEVPHDANNCPVRGRVDPDQLWDAIRPTAPPGSG